MRSPLPLPHLLCACACLLPLFSLQSGSDPLDHVSAYSLHIGPDGQALPGHFPIGLRGGGISGDLPLKVVHAGFNVWQVQPDNPGFTAGEPFRSEDEREGALHERYGFFYYTQARAMLSLRRGRQKPPGQLGPYTFPPFIQEDGMPAKKGTPLINVFSPSARRYFTDYMTELGQSSWGLAPVGNPTLFWGMDNEWEGRLDYSPEARAAFVDWLRNHFHGIDDLNRTWGTRFGSFEEIRDSSLPKAEEFATRPGEFLAWHTFQSEWFTNLLADAARALHDADPHHRPVIYKSTQQTIEYPFVKRLRIFDQVLFGQRARAFGGGILGVNMYGAGDRQSYETSYIANIARPLDDGPETYGVMCPEINNHSGPGHQWGATFWRVLSNGLKAANFFTIGFKGATGDYATFGHFGPDGKPRDKMFYAARWAQMIHRSERLWTESRPVEGVPRIAMLLPRRDVILSERTDRRVSKWAYPLNHRVMVYGWLREQGFWVDVIPETKLNAAFLSKNYQALVLIGAEHLSKEEAAAITDYVKSGGVLVADERAGCFDELHRERQWLEPVLGLKFGGRDLGFRQILESGPLRGARITGKFETKPAGANVLMTDNSGQPIVTEHAVGNGRAFHVGFLIGDIRENMEHPVKVSVFKAAGSNETADTGDESTPEKASLAGRWLKSLLDHAGIKPAYTVHGLPPVEAAVLRVEQPVADTRGNVVVVAATRGTGDQNERVPPAEVELPLPGGPWQYAAWGAAEDGGLQSVPVKHVRENIHRISLPAIKTAGVLYLLKDHAPLVGIPAIEAPDRAVDGHAARVRPAIPFAVRVQLANPSPHPVAAGELQLAAPQGWSVEPASAPTRALEPGEILEQTFTVIPAAADEVRPDWLYPLVARWKQDGKDRSIGAANVEVLPP